MGIATRFKLVLIIAGVVLVFLSVQEMRLAAVTRLTPQEISCEELCLNGPGDNAHVALIDFILCDFSFVYEESEKGQWENIWIPAVPLQTGFHPEISSNIGSDGDIYEDLPVSLDIRVIVKSSRVKNDAALDRFTDQERIQGLIVNKISSLGKDERKILEEHYPGVDFHWAASHQRYNPSFSFGVAPPCPY